VMALAALGAASLRQCAGIRGRDQQAGDRPYCR
jgi:hypothetical protein